MKQPTTILIVDDHPIFRRGVCAILDKMEGIKIVGEAENGESALAQLRLSRPDIVLLDLAMPGMDGLSVLKTVRAEFSDLIVVIITSYKDNVYLKNALKMGANGFLLKDDAGENLIDCIHRVLLGEIYLSPIFGKPEARLPPSGAPGAEHLFKLTRSECKVLKLVARYMTSKEIAEALNISHRTVQNHRCHISRKLGIKGIHQLASFAHQHQEQLTPLSAIPATTNSKDKK